MSALMSGFIWFLVRLLLSVIFYGTPLLGFWLASSLAAFLGNPQWMAWTAGAFLFPIIPGFWELYSWSHRRPDSKAWFTLLDRLSLRTFAVGLAFLALLLYLYPQASFVSLSTRGDWMLDGMKDSRADKARHVLFAAAGGLEWLYRFTKNNPYKAHIDTKERQRAEDAAKQREQELARQRELETTAGQDDQKDKTTEQHNQEIAQQDDSAASQQDKGQHELESTQKNVAQLDDNSTSREGESKGAPDGLEAAQKHVQDSAQQQKAAQFPDKKWPWKQTTLHPAIATMPVSVETSIEAVAHYISKKEKDPILRIKALHDYVADRVAYDSDSYYSGEIPDQDAESVFKKRKSVCAGYANLLSALAEAINEKIIVVTGDARGSDTNDKLAGNGHAWNAACIGGRWYLIDACWDAGYVSREKGFTKCYKTDYLLPPPEVMIEDHFPEQSTWQLLAQPLSQGEFLRQPMLSPRFHAADLTLVAPRRACNETGSKAVVIVKNPDHQWLMAGLEQNGIRIGNACDPTNSETAQLECPLPNKGTYRLNLFANKQVEYGRYDFIGSLDFVSR